MRAVFLTLPVACVAVIATSPAFAQLAGKPVYPRVAAPVTFLLTQDGQQVEPSSFATYREFYAHLAKQRGIADPESELAIQQIESHASVEHLHDYSGEPIIVVKLDPPRTGDNSSFFVLREKDGRMRLLGEMSARSYESTTTRGHLEFVLDVGRRVAQAPRYQVDGDFLINLADLATLDRNDPVELDVKNGF